jgi:hypothetical protein
VFISFIGVSLLLPHSGPQSGSGAARWQDGFVSGKTATTQTSLFLTVLLTRCTRLVVALSQGVALEGSLDVWLHLWEDSHGPLQLVLDGLVDLDFLAS